MSTLPPSINIFERLYARWREKYIIRVQLMGQQVSFVAASIGIVYILVNANLTRLQTIHLFVSVFGLVGIANFLMPIYTHFITPHARKRLQEIWSGQEPSDGNIESAAWKEIIVMPWRFAVAAVLSACIPVVAGIGVYMHYIAGTTGLQTLQVVIGGLLSGIGLAIQITLFLDRALTPARVALLPRDPAKQSAESGVKLQTRMRIIFGALITLTIVMVGPLGYQKLLNAMTPGVDQAANLRLFETQLIIISVIGLAASVGIASMLAYLVARPVRGIIQVMKEVESGHLSARAIVYTSDETAELTIRLNHMLDRLQGSQTEMEKRVNERTNDLFRRASMLQAATQVARQAVASQDLNVLLKDTAGLISDRFNYYHTGIFLVDENSDYAVLHATSSEGGRRMLERGYRLAIGRQGIVGNAAYFNRPRIVSNIGEDAVFFDNPDLPGTRSEAALPLGVRGKVIGVLDIQSIEPNAFPADVIELLQTMADQIALAIQNARLLTESQNALQRLEAATLEGVRRTWSDRAKTQKRSYVYTPLGLAPHAPAATKSGSQSSEPTTRFDVPITLRGQKIGGLVFHRKGGTPWPDSDRTLAVEVANQIGLALENTRLLEEAQHRAIQEQSLSELTAKLSQSLDPNTIMQTAVRELHQLPNVREVSVYITPPETDATEGTTK